VKAIFNQTIKRMFRLRGLLLYFGILLLVVLFASLSSGRGLHKESLFFEVSYSQGFLLIISFIWLTGIPYIINLSAKGIGLFAGEEAEGTMSLLAMKPVKRYEIVLGKLLGLFAGSIIYQLISLVFAIFIFAAIASLDSDAILQMLGSIPGLLLYALLLTLFFIALSGTMSVIFKKRVAGIIVVLLFVFAAYGIIPLFRGLFMISGLYERYRMYIFDISYQFGVIFKTFILLFSRTDITMAALDSLDAFFGDFFISKSDMDIILPPGYSRQWVNVSYISPAFLIVLYLLITALLFAFIFVRMNKKDLG